MHSGPLTHSYCLLAMFREPPTVFTTGTVCRRLSAACSADCTRVCVRPCVVSNYAATVVFALFASSLHGMPELVLFSCFPLLPTHCLTACPLLFSISAICSFRLITEKHLFRSTFKTLEELHNNWLWLVSGEDVFNHKYGHKTSQAIALCVIIFI